MANEINISVNLQVNKGDFTFNRQKQITVDQSGTGGGNPGTLSIGTSDTAVTFTGLTTPKYCFVQNLHASQTVDVGPDSGGAIVDLITLASGEIALFPLHASTTLRMQASGASTPVLVEAIEA